MANLFEALADRARLRILFVLADCGECPAGELTEHTGLAAQTVSHHLRTLRLHRLVETRRAHRHVFYRLAQPSMGDGVLSIGAAGGGGVRIVLRPVAAGVEELEEAAGAEAAYREVARTLGPLSPFVWAAGDVSQPSANA